MYGVFALLDHSLLKEVPPGLSLPAPAVRKDTWGRVRVCALNDPRNDVKMNKTHMKPQATGEWLHLKVLNILMSFPWESEYSWNELLWH